MKNLPDSLKPFDFHSVEFHEVPKVIGNVLKGQARGTCPFCPGGRTKKFYVNVESQLWDCKHCGLKGNLTVFLQEILRSAVEGTTTDHYKELANDRFGIEWKLFKEYEFGRDTRFAEPRWLIPIYDLRGTLVSLAVYQYGKKVIYTAGLPLFLWRLNTLKGAGPIIVCEGQWDAMAMERLRRKCGMKANILCVPGATTFKADWCNIFHGREVTLLYDNDSSGDEGSKAAAYKLQGHASKVRRMNWPAATPDKWDVRDQIHQELDKNDTEAKDVWKAFENMSHEVHSAPIAPGGEATPIALTDDYPKRSSFASVLKDFRKSYHMDLNMEDGLALMFASVLSIQMPGDPIWLFIVGPPGCGKTLLLRSFEKSPYCIFKSAIGPKALISGYRVEGGGEQADPSLIPKLTGKTLVLKDYTEIITMPKEEQEAMYGILRGAYDGHAERTFGNGLTRYYPNCYFAMLAGVTDVIHYDDRASLGERFLKFQMVEGDTYVPDEHIERAISGMAKQVEVDELIRKISAGFTIRELNSKSLPSPPKWVVTRLIALSQIIAYLRASVPRMGRDEMAYRPSPEVGTRLAKQLLKLGHCLAVVYGNQKNVIDEKCYRLMERVAFDTARGWNLDIIRLIMRFYPSPVYREVIQDKLAIPPSTCNRRLEALLALKAIIRQRTGKALPNQFGNAPPAAGQPAFGYTVAPNIADLWKRAGLPIGDDIKPSKKGGVTRGQITRPKRAKKKTRA